ncbi:MAG: FtsK/SpoIIIE domain-containing protein [Planctomyces sp.]
MAVTLTVSEVRDALYQADRVAGGEPSLATTALLGRWFHEGLSFLVSRDSAAGLLGVLAAGPADLTSWKLTARARLYESVVGPRLTRSCALLRESASQVLVFWQAMQAAADWFAELAWHVQLEWRRGHQLPGVGGRRGVEQPVWQLLAECFESEVPVECELSDPAWSDTVRLVGIADWVCRPAGVDRWCVVEFKTGSTSPEADLGQACLYHLILGELSRRRGLALDAGGALALIRFAPERHELLLTVEQLESVRGKLLALIGRLAGVSSGGAPGAAVSAAGAAGAVSGAQQRGGGALSAAGGGTVVSSGAAARRNLKSSTDCGELGRRIVAAFREYGVLVTLDDEVVVGPSFIRFTLIPGLGPRVTAIEQRSAELQIRLGLGAEPFISRGRGRLVLDVQRPDRQVITFDEVRESLSGVRSSFGSTLVPVGVDFSGELICADLSKPEHCHFLVAGTTGSGKSEWLRMAIAGLMIRNTPETLRLLVIDPKRNAFHALRNSPFLLQPLVFPDEQPVGEVLEQLCAEMEARYAMMNGADTIADAALQSGRRLPRIVCVCDEYRDLISRGRRERREIESKICRLGAKARAAGIHLILATQEASRDTIRGPLDTNLPARVGLKMGRDLESRMLLGVRGAEKLLGHGDLLFRDTQDPRRLQAPLLTEANRAEIFGG